ncbi:MAG TPA: 2OG-Fe(II) oxygenase [Pyrinomonadaceae bacterium]|nr:2OG-Fe(II) oxygenase [Pyrinomonadaceae bacterium]
MIETDGAARFGLLLVRDFLGARECAALAAELRAAEGGPAAVYGRGESGAVDERVRRAARLVPSRGTVEFVIRRLSDLKPRVEEHFGRKLAGCEEPQFLRYREGDFFVAHQDGNTGLLRSEREARLVSVVIFLSRQADESGDGDYGGGALVFSDWRPGSPRGEFRLGGEPGALVAFRAETTHEVTPVTHGERLSIACWYN